MKRTPIYNSRDHLLNDTPIGVIELPDDVLQLLGDIAIELGGRLLLDVTKVDVANKQVLGFYLHPAPVAIAFAGAFSGKARSSTDVYLCRSYFGPEPVDG